MLLAAKYKLLTEQFSSFKEQYFSFILLSWLFKYFNIAQTLQLTRIFIPLNEHFFTWTIIFLYIIYYILNIMFLQNSQYSQAETAKLIFTYPSLIDISST